MKRLESIITALVIAAAAAVVVLVLALVAGLKGND